MVMAVLMMVFVMMFVFVMVLMTARMLMFFFFHSCLLLFSVAKLWNLLCNLVANNAGMVKKCGFIGNF